MRKKKSILNQISLLFLTNIIKFIESNGLNKNQILKDLFGTPIRKNCRLFEEFEKRNDEYVVIPVIIKRSRVDQIEQLLKLNRETLEEILEELKDKYTEVSAKDIESEILKQMCLFGECNDSDEQNQQKRKNRRKKKRNDNNSFENETDDVNELNDDIILEDEEIDIE